MDFAKYSSLNVLGMLGLSGYILADTFFISKSLGTNGLAALNLAIPIYSFISGIGLMIGMGAGTKFSIQKSRQNQKNSNRIFTNAVYLTAIFSVLLFLSGLFLSESIVRVLRADENLFSMTKTYIQVLLLFAPAFLTNNLLICFVRNDGAPQLSMAAMLGGSVSNIILDYIFIFPLQMGMFGAVLATALAPIISILILSPHFIKKKNNFHFARCKFSAEFAAGFFSSGLPSLITEMSSGIVMIIFNNIILSLQGNTGVAAYGIIANLSLVVIAVYTGIAQGIQPIISSNFGAGNTKKIQSILKYALTTMLLLSAFIYTGIFFKASSIASIFNSECNQLLQAIAVQGLKLYFIACPFVGFNIIISIYFTSTDYAKPAHIISFLRGFLLIIPMVFFLSKLFGITGVWLSFPATEFLVMLLGTSFYIVNQQKKKKKNTEIESSR